MTEILDRNGTRITVGARVVDKHWNEEGTVTDLTEPDADVNEYGRAIPYGPFVIVDYDNGSRERWTATWNATGPWDDDRDDYTCDDVTVAPPLSDYDLAHRLVDAEEQGDAQTQAECLNEICGRLNLPLNMTKQGLTDEANRRIELWIDANWTRGEGVDLDAVEALERYAADTKPITPDTRLGWFEREPDGQRIEAGRIIPTDR